MKKLLTAAGMFLWTAFACGQSTVGVAITVQNAAGTAPETYTVTIPNLPSGAVYNGTAEVARVGTVVTFYVQVDAPVGTGVENRVYKVVFDAATQTGNATLVIADIDGFPSGDAVTLDAVCVLGTDVLVTNVIDAAGVGHTEVWVVDATGAVSTSNLSECPANLSLVTDYEPSVDAFAVVGLPIVYRVYTKEVAANAAEEWWCSEYDLVTKQRTNCVRLDLPGGWQAAQVDKLKPVKDAAGLTEGWLLEIDDGNPATPTLLHYWPEPELQSSPPGTTRPVVSSNNRIRNSTQIPGTGNFRYAETDAASNTVMRDAKCVFGDSASALPGQVATFRCHTPLGPSPQIAGVLLGAPSPAPISLAAFPFVIGNGLGNPRPPAELALAPGFTVLFTITAPYSGGADFLIPVPLGLSPMQLGMQYFMIDDLGTIYASNDALLRVL